VVTKGGISRLSLKIKGVAETSWQTITPNRKGNGGTATGSHTVTTSNVTGSWNGVATSAIFNLLP